MLCCCGAEIAALVVGLLTIDKGVFQLGQWRMVRGMPAYVIGGILASMLPLLLITAGILRVIEAITGNPPTPLLQNAILSPAFAVVLIGFPAVVVIIIAAGENPNRRTAPAARRESPSDIPNLPMDPGSPYASPLADDQIPEPDKS